MALAGVELETLVSEPDAPTTSMCIIDISARDRTSVLTFRDFVPKLGLLTSFRDFLGISAI